MNYWTQVLATYCLRDVHILKKCSLKKNQTTPRLSEHPPVMGEKNVNLARSPYRILHTYLSRVHNYIFASSLGITFTCLLLTLCPYLEFCCYLALLSVSFSIYAFFVLNFQSSFFVVPL